MERHSFEPLARRAEVGDRSAGIAMATEGLCSDSAPEAESAAISSSISVAAAIFDPEAKRDVQNVTEHCKCLCERCYHLLVQENYTILNVAGTK